MKPIVDILKEKKTLSFEVFPPKKEDEFAKAFEVLDKLALMQPDFISVTYGAGGSRSKKTTEIASYITKQCGINALVHMTCVGAKKQQIDEVCEELKNNGLHQILALRGDRPQYMSDEEYMSREFEHASDLMEYLSSKECFTLAGAAYPEKHYESISLEADLENLKKKQEAGASILISQLFFDNNMFLRFREKARKQGIDIPILPGIMPITTANQLGTTVSLSGSSIPKELSDIIATYGDNKEDMRKAGIDFAIRQIQGLMAEDVDGIHIYSMNKPKMTQEIVDAIR